MPPRLPPRFAAAVQGGALDRGDSGKAVKGRVIVYANLAGSVDKVVTAIVAVMEANGVKRLIFISALGIYPEIPGAFGRFRVLSGAFGCRNERMIGRDLARSRRAAASIEGLQLDYTVIRPTWLTDNDEAA